MKTKNINQNFQLTLSGSGAREGFDLDWACMIAEIFLTSANVRSPFGRWIIRRFFLKIRRKIHHYYFSTENLADIISNREKIKTVQWIQPFLVRNIWFGPRTFLMLFTGNNHKLALYLPFSLFLASQKISKHLLVHLSPVWYPELDSVFVLLVGLEGKASRELRFAELANTMRYIRLLVNLPTMRQRQLSGGVPQGWDKSHPIYIRPK